MTVTFTDTAGPLSEGSILKAEKKFGRTIPDSFRHFLLKHNGARPSPSNFVMAGRRVGTTQFGAVKRFLGIGTAERTLNLDYALETFAERLPNWFFPIARDPGGSLIGIATTGPNSGSIYFWDHEFEAEEGEPPKEDNVYFIAESFDEFLNKLQD